ncbi:hypothetical protein FPQ18DRAFT_400766 [Pyronema domesticum]|nr:hypothetical protein FPQ18DRAFT_400766 [Pyronema domesticum]
MAKRKKSNKSQNQQNQNQKRPRNDDGEHKNNQFAGSHGYIDPVTGQRGAFPGLDGDEDFFGPPMDGMDYLRMVRSEAKGVPALLLSASALAKAPPIPRERPQPPTPKRPAMPIEKDVILDYDDPSPVPTAEVPGSDEIPELDPEPEVDYDATFLFTESTSISLLPSAPATPLPLTHHITIQKFHKLRSNMASYPSPQKGPMPGWMDNRIIRQWLTHTPPKTGWIAAMRQGEILKMIKAFTYWMQWRVKVRNTATRGVARCWMLWIWGLLGRFEETRAADESVVVRELGKAAVASLKALKEGIEAAEAEAEEEYEEEVLEEEVTEEAAAEGDDGAYEPPEFMGEPSNAEVTMSAKPAAEEPEEGELEEGEEMEIEVAKPVEAPEEGEEGELEEGEEPEPKTEAPKQAASATTVEVDHQVLSIEDTMASLDMIISIVGDFFGQRDLLEDRAAMK